MLLILNTLIADFFVLSLAISLAVGAITTNLLDRQLKGKWASGRTFYVSPESIATQKHGTTEAELNPQKLVNPLFWHFEVTRNTRVKKGWLVVGFGMEQDDTFITLYTFVPPDGLESLPFGKQFTRLKKSDSDDLKQAGLQRRLLTAEAHRHNEGAEVTQAQFVDILNHLQASFPKWMPKSS